MSCIFCRIAEGSVPAHIVWQDDLIVAFLDSHPIRPGHLQIIPREHHAYFTDLPADTAARIIHVGQRLAKAAKALNDVPRVAFLFTGGDIPHAHAHVVPMHKGTDITSRRYIANAEVTFCSTDAATAEELAHVASLLRNSIA